MKEKFVTAFETVLAANKGGEVRNLLITDNDEDFLDEALYQLRCWCVDNGFNLVEIDEKESAWISEIQSRDLFFKLNQPNTLLMIKNYATERFHSFDENTPRNFLRDIVMNRHYGCGNDFVPSDELPNLLFAVVINDLSDMKWRQDEYELFDVIHGDDTKRLWTNTKFSLMSSKMHPVMSRVNKPVYFVSEDEATLCFDVGNAFGIHRLRRPIRYYTASDRTDIIHTYLENNLPDFHERVECLILKMSRFVEDEHFVIDGRRLKKYFPDLTSVYCKDMFEIADAQDEICVLDPFDLGEMSFHLALDGDIPMANSFVRDLWALDHKCARFFREVAKDYYRKTKDHPKGMDHLFHIYLLGWYHIGDDFFDDADKVFVTKHKNFDKAIGLLPVRFQDCSVDEVADRLYWDLQHVKNDQYPDYEQFAAVLSESERLVPGVSAKMREKYGDCES